MSKKELKTKCRWCKSKLIPNLDNTLLGECVKCMDTDEDEIPSQKANSSSVDQIYERHIETCKIKAFSVVMEWCKKLVERQVTSRRR